MSYTKTNWENKPSRKTPIDAENLNHMENGIAEAHEQLDNLPQWSKQEEKPKYTYDEVGADKQGTAKVLVEQHNESDTAHEDIRAILSDLEIYKANSITQTLACDTIVTTDSAKVGLVGMKTYGKSTQKRYEGNQPSPSPEYPQEIVSVGDEGSVGVGVYGGNLIPPTTNASTTNNGITYDVLEDGIIHAYGTSTESSEFIYLGGWLQETGVSIPKGFKYSKKIDGSQFTMNMYGFNDAGAYVHIENTDDSAYSDVTITINLNKGIEVNEYIRPYACKEEIITDYAVPQSLTIQTPNGLPGIPLGKTIPDVIKNSAIHMSGVYWDSDEEQYYIADTVDYGKGEYVQRILRGNLDGSSVYGFNNNGVWHLSAGSIKTIFNGNIISFGENSYYNPAISDCFIIQNSSYNVNAAEQWKNTIYLSDTGEEMLLNASLFPSVDNEGFKAFFTEHPTKIYVIAESPITTPLTEEELIQYKSLHMNYPNTTIINDEGAYMEVEYVADTKSYIEQNYTPKSEIEEMKNQIAELQSLVVNNV